MGNEKELAEYSSKMEELNRKPAKELEGIVEKTNNKISKHDSIRSLENSVSDLKKTLEGSSNRIWN